jgi:hypothetical protein
MTEIVNRITGQCVTLPEGTDAQREQAVLEYASQKERSNREYGILLECEARLAPYLRDLRESLPDSKGIGYLNANGVKLEVVFKDGAEWDGPTLDEAEKVIPKIFPTLFDTAVTRKPQLRALNQWLKSQSSDETENIAREVIRTAKKPAAVPPKPYIKVVSMGTIYRCTEGE